MSPPCPGTTARCFSKRRRSPSSSPTWSPCGSSRRPTAPSSEPHKGGLGPLFYKDLPEPGKDVFRKRLAARFGRLDERLSRNMYLMGDAFTIADAGLYAMTSWCPRVAFDVGQWPNVGAHHARVAERPSVQRVHEVAGDQSLHCLKSLKG